MARQETIADIIAEKRRRAFNIERDCAEKMKRGEMVSSCYARELVADIRCEADRLEAALALERGDAAKLREAIVHMIDTADSIAVREPTGAIGKLAFHIKHTVDAALSAPPRNCDRFATLPDALAAWRDIDPREAGPFDTWLFASATEKEESEAAND